MSEVYAVMYDTGENDEIVDIWSTPELADKSRDLWNSTASKWYTRPPYFIKTFELDVPCPRP